MKLVLLFSLGLSFTLFSAFASADSFELIKDGKNYLCEETSPVIDPGGRLKCVDKAYSGPFSKEEAGRICEGARDEKPAICAIKAYNGPFAKEEAIQLCVRAKGDGPVDCAIKAYNGPYSKEEALRLCKGEAKLALKSLNLIEQSSELQEKLRTLKK